MQDWDIVVMKPLQKALEECSIGMRLRSTLLLAPAASMDQLQRRQLDSVCPRLTLWAAPSVGQCRTVVSTQFSNIQQVS